MLPGDLRQEPFQDNVVSRHRPPSSLAVASFMGYFEEQFRLARLGAASKVAAIAIAHHRFNYVHRFPDGNGRVSRLMSHAMAQCAGIGAHGLWSISRGLSRGLSARSRTTEHRNSDCVRCVTSRGGAAGGGCEDHGAPRSRREGGASPAHGGWAFGVGDSQGAGVTAHLC